MDIVLESLIQKMQTTELDINIHVKATFNVTPFVARQKVNMMLLDRVGTGLLSESPGTPAILPG